MPRLGPLIAARKAMDRAVKLHAGGDVRTGMESVALNHVTKAIAAKPAPLPNKNTFRSE